MDLRPYHSHASWNPSHIINICLCECVSVCVPREGKILHLLIVPVPLLGWSQAIALDSVLFQGTLSR